MNITRPSEPRDTRMVRHDMPVTTVCLAAFHRLQNGKQADDVRQAANPRGECIHLQSSVGSEEVFPRGFTIRSEVEHVNLLAAGEHHQPAVRAEPTLTARNVFPGERQ